jgi:hypothetical protein
VTPLTVAEAKAILAADSVIGIEHEARFDVEACDAWDHLVASARDRVATFEGQRRQP